MSPKAEPTMKDAARLLKWFTEPKAGSTCPYTIEESHRIAAFVEAASAWSAKELAEKPTKTDKLRMTIWVLNDTLSRHPESSSIRLVRSFAQEVLSHLQSALENSTTEQGGKGEG